MGIYTIIHIGGTLVGIPYYTLGGTLVGIHPEVERCILVGMYSLYMPWVVPWWVYMPPHMLHTLHPWVYHGHTADPLRAGCVHHEQRCAVTRPWAHTRD